MSYAGVVSGGYSVCHSLVTAMADIFPLPMWVDTCIESPLGPLLPTREKFQLH